ncbi:MAG TPA: D-glycero-beta-D-manno-heptose 1,7-bisphosphate 7-phosphatase [Candidatus Binatia bacterium]|nr:D-glycero-beta-D-manno-heptose 1,7-bisphosphate 7-phosphatase [Candidatus Binatia bacterium]
MKLVILDRDGVINEDSDAFIKSVAEWKPIPGSLEAIARLCHAGWRVAIASNQSGIGRGLMDYGALFAIHDRLQRAVCDLGGRIDAIEFAPDHPDRPSEFRKPAPGMLLDLARRLGATLDRVPAVGDSWRDVEAARAARARPVLVRTGNGRRTESEHRAGLDGVAVHDDLAAFAASLIGS